MREKIRESRLRWYVHVKRKEEDEFVRWSAERRETGTRKRGRRRKRWMDCVRDDGKVVDLSRVGDRRQWRGQRCRPDPTPLEGTNGMMMMMISNRNKKMVAISIQLECITDSNI